MHFNIYEHDKFHAQLNCMKKKIQGQILQDGLRWV